MTPAEVLAIIAAWGFVAMGAGLVMGRVFRTRRLHLVVKGKKR